MSPRPIFATLLAFVLSDAHGKPKKPDTRHKTEAIKKSKKTLGEGKKNATEKTKKERRPEAPKASENLLSPYGIEVNASNALLLDYKSRRVLLEKNADLSLEPVSMTKIMTAYVIARALKEGKIKETDMVTVSKRAREQEGSRMFLEIGQRVSVIDLLKGILIVSGNDASVAMAEFLSGTEANFAAEMTRIAKEMGCEGTNFKNASGIPEEGHHSTARDLAIMAIRLFEDFPEYYYVNKEIEYTFNGITQQNRNLLLNKNIGCDGVKTGFAETPGYGMVASAAQNDRRLFLVCTGLRSKRQRAAENSKLLEWGFKAFADYAFAPPGETLAEIPVRYGVKDTVPIEPMPRCLALNRGQLNRVKVTLKYVSALEAPVKAKTPVGEAIVTHPDWPEPVIVKLVTALDVPEAFFLTRVGQTLAYMFSESEKPLKPTPTANFKD